MSYFAPFIDQTGLHIPTFDDIKSYVTQQYQSIYGQTVDLNNGDADIQWISIFSLMMNDAMNTANLCYNGRSPVTAIGGDLDAVVKINGVTRKSSIPSQVVLTLTGIAGTFVENALAQDVNGNLWQITNATILNTGSVNTNAFCLTDGAVTAVPNTVNIISTPVSGWTGVNNANAAIPGVGVESDSQLRGRQAISVSLSAKTLVDSTISGIAAVTGVTRYGTIGVENPTGATDVYGNPPHSISMVVEGGADLDVATAIYNNKTPGCLTNGTTTVPVVDPQTFNTMNISFFRPTYTPIYVTMNVHQLVGYTSATTTDIRQAVTDYLNSLQIGESLTISGIYAAAMSVMPNISLPEYSVQAVFAGTAPSPSGTIDIPINFNGVVSGLFANVLVNLV